MAVVVNGKSPQNTGNGLGNGAGDSIDVVAESISVRELEIFFSLSFALPVSPY